MQCTLARRDIGHTYWCVYLRPRRPWFINFKHRKPQVTYNPQMEKDEKLEEFVQVLGRIRELVGEESMSGGTGIDLADVVEQWRHSGNDTDADELGELIKRAEALKAQHKADS